jgi:hypothetical protein
MLVIKSAANWRETVFGAREAAAKKVTQQELEIACTNDHEATAVLRTSTRVFMKRKPTSAGEGRAALAQEARTRGHPVCRV